MYVDRETNFANPPLSLSVSLPTQGEEGAGSLTNCVHPVTDLQADDKRSECDQHSVVDLGLQHRLCD